MSEKKQFDPGQQAAIDIRANAVVSAGAGSGKTTVLAERFAQLVEKDGLPLDSILTLTFTKKAAAEMYSRIYKRLSQSHDPRVKQELLGFDRARIMTLDAFCASIVRGGSQRYGISPDFAVDENRLGRLADETAVAFLMDHRTDHLIRRLVAVYSFDRIRTEFLADFALHCCSLCGAPDFTGDSRRQVAFLEARLKELAGNINDLLFEMRRVAPGAKPSTTYTDIRKVLDTIPELDAQEEPDSLGEKVRAIAGLTTIRSNITNPALVELREPVALAKSLAGELSMVIEGLDLREELLATGKLLDLFSAQFAEKKRREGLLSFSDTAELAVDILRCDTALRAHYKRAIRAIMIDEFQDNNELQKSLLYLLAERMELMAPGIPSATDLDPKKLFFVGDEKQSIYRFRGADVSVFRKLALELGTEDSPALETNYRSAPALLAFFNAFFPGAFGDAGEDYEARFQPIAIPEKADGAPAALESPVEFHVLEDRKDSEEDLSGLESEAFAAAARIASGVRAGEFRLGEVAILFRTTTTQHEYEKALRLLRIPYLAADPRGLFREAPANDIYAYLSLLLFPADRNAWAVVLRSPFIALSDESVARILLDIPGEPFPEQPGDWFTAPDDRRRYLAARERWLEYRDAVDKIGSAALIARLWYETGYRNALLANERSIAYLNHFDLIYRLALSADARQLPLSAFLDELAPLVGTSEKVEGDELPEGIEAVKLMTIHKSKGLEFPVVILAGLGRGANSQKNAKPWYRHSEFGPILNFKDEEAARKERRPNYFYEKAKEADRDREVAELRRLLYVAATRAEKKLLVFTSVTPNKDILGSISGLEGADRAFALLKSIKTDKNGDDSRRRLQDLAAAGLRGLPEDMPLARTLIESLDHARRLQRARELALEVPRADTATMLAAFYTVAPLAPIHEPRGSSSPSAMERAAAHEADSGAPALPSLPIDALIDEYGLEALFGTLCHRAIECALSSLPFSVPAPVSAQLAASGLPEADHGRLTAEAGSLASAFLDSELGQWARSSKRRKTEFPFLLPLFTTGEKPCIIRGTMDLVFEHGDNCLIVDFKTDRRRDPGLHSVQMACYRAAIGAFSDRKPISFLYYFRGSETVRVDTDIETGQLYRLALLTEEQRNG